jgi:hypothetical protein
MRMITMDAKGGGALRFSFLFIIGVQIGGRHGQLFRRFSVFLFCERESQCRMLLVLGTRASRE